MQPGHFCSWVNFLNKYFLLNCLFHFMPILFRYLGYVLALRLFSWYHYFSWIVYAMLKAPYCRVIVLTTYHIKPIFRQTLTQIMYKDSFTVKYVFWLSDLRENFIDLMADHHRLILRTSKHCALMLHLPHKHYV